MGVLCAAYCVFSTGIAHRNEYVLQVDSERPVVYEDANGNKFVLCQDCNKLSAEKRFAIKIGDDQKLIASCPHCKQVLDMPAYNSMLHKMQEK